MHPEASLHPYLTASAITRRWQAPVTKGTLFASARRLLDRAVARDAPDASAPPLRITAL